MAIAGLCLIAGSLKDGLGDTKIDAPFLVAIAAAFFLNNLALGFAAGIVAHTLANIFDRQRSLTLSNIIAAVVSVGFIALTVILRFFPRPFGCPPLAGGPFSITIEGSD